MPEDSRGRILDVHVNGGDDGISILGGFDDFLHIGLIIQISVLSSIGSCQLVIVILLNSAASLFSVIVGKSHNIAGQRIIRIKSPVLVLKPDTFDLLPAVLLRLRVGIIQFFLFCLKFFLFVRGDLLLVGHIIGIFIGRDRCQKIRAVVSKHLAEG